MLSHLHVRDLAIIDAVDVTFGPGLNVITGETGAGKSILVLAIDLLMGGRGRTRPDVVRAGAEAAEIAAVFDVADDPALRRRLEEAGFGGDEELGVQRVVEAKGRGRTYLNGRATSAAVLGEVASGLCDISSQHEHHTLSDPRSHMAFLDMFAGLTGLGADLAAAALALADASRRARGLDADERTRAERLDLVRFQLQEIDAATPLPDEDLALRVERERLRHAERLGNVTGAAEDALYGRDGSICGELAALGASLVDLRALDPALDGPAEAIEAARLSLEDAALSLGRYARSVSVDPARLAEVDERLHLLERLTRKFGGSVASVMEHRERLAAELGRLGSHEELLARALAEKDEALGRAGALARALSARRREAAAELGMAISGELSSLGMGGARVVVDVTPATAADGDLVVDGARLGPDGIDRVEFLIAPNRGEDARPLRRIASGGELSRAMLAVKRVLSGLGPAGTYVFDEVDAGVGGAVAEVIGQKLRQVADHHQVLCITHLPQIAVYADRHFVVRKEALGQRTVSRIEALGEKDRLDEVARMLGGLRVTPRTRAAAAEMLRQAERAVAS
ncbi:MAG: DNA repair protein RecN [Deltaproteobacteria bacterium]|nr:DNA repair protein RecN [Deltaproteobacteria bacterium]